MLIPPLAQLALCFAIAGGLAAFLPIWEFHAPNWLIVLEAVLGVLFLMPAVVSFVRHQTTVNPQTPSDATTLVTGGIYGISRNPMYVGMLLLLLAFVLWLGNVSAALASRLKLADRVKADWIRRDMPAGKPISTVTPGISRNSRCTVSRSRRWSNDVPAGKSARVNFSG